MTELDEALDRACLAYDIGYVCTLPKGHDGQHQASGPDDLVVFHSWDE